MRLYTSSASPFGAKVKIIAHACSILKDIEIIEHHPFALEKKYQSSVNPLNKVPSLVLDNQTTLFDSKIISQYIIENFNEALYKKDKWHQLNISYLCDGALDALLSIRYEKNFRPQYLSSIDWCERNESRVLSALDCLEAKIKSAIDNDLQMDLINISIFNLIDYIIFRFSNEYWIKNIENFLHYHDKFLKKHSDLSDLLVKDIKTDMQITQIAK